jgi:hypothetical protein
MQGCVELLHRQTEIVVVFDGRICRGRRAQTRKQIYRCNFAVGTPRAQQQQNCIDGMRCTGIG